MSLLSPSFKKINGLDCLNCGQRLEIQADESALAIEKCLPSPTRQQPRGLDAVGR